MLLNIDDSEKQRILEMYGVNRKLLIEEVTLSATKKSTYPPGSSDPSEFIDTFVTDIINQINGNTEAKKMYDSGKMMISKFTVAAGSSNNWNGVTTSYSLDNSAKGYSTPATVPVVVDTDKNLALYNKNLALAKKRGETFYTTFIAKLAEKNIKVSNSVGKKISTFVVNTGGKLDDDRDVNLHPQPGQYIGSSITVGYENDVQKFNKDITTIDKVTKDFVLTGSYYCNGSNAIDRGKKMNVSNEDTYKPMCDAVIKKYPNNLAELSKYISAFEIKWSPGILKNPWDQPVMRWEFTWSDDGSGNLKITSVKLKKINKSLVPASIFPSEASSTDDVNLKHMMGITEGDPTGGGTIYKTYIQPYK